MSIFQAAETDAADMWLAKEVGETLEKHYPGWLWAVKIKGGILFIQSLIVCEQLSMSVKNSAAIGMVIHLNNIMHDAKVRGRKVVMGAGEFLERVNQKRGKITDDAQNIKRMELH